MTDKLSDKGRVYVSDNHDIATVAQSGVITGVSDGVTIVRIYASDGKTQIGECTVAVSTAAVRIPCMLAPGQEATVGIEVRSCGNTTLTGSLRMTAISGFAGRNTGTVYGLEAFSRGSGGSYSKVSEGSIVVQATATAGQRASQNVDFKVEPAVSLNSLVPDDYDATVIWKLDLNLE